MMGHDRAVRGAGLGLRFEFLDRFAEAVPHGVDFVEVTAEHYIHRTGAALCLLEAVLEQVPAICHGLNANLGGPAPLDETYLLSIRRLLDRYGIGLVSDHLCHSSDEEWMHILMPIPFTEEAVFHTAGRIRRAREILERPVAIENISYLVAPGQRMPEADFYTAVLEEADCLALLDVNNLYVNSRNLGYDAKAFLDAIPVGRIAYAHMAGHDVVNHAGDGENDLVLYRDSHGHPLADSVFDLLDAAYSRHGVFPTCVERDQNVPPVPELVAELDAIRKVQERQQAAAGGSRPMNARRNAKANAPGCRPAGIAGSAGRPARNETTSPAPDDSIPIAEVQRQFTRYLRDPDNAPLPPGTDARRMRVYAGRFRVKLLYALRERACGLVEALGEDRVLVLLSEHVRLPHAERSRETSFPGAFFQWLKSQWANHDLPPWIPDLADYCLAAMLTASPLELAEPEPAGESDLLAGVPIFSELARLLRLEWPAHRIGGDFIPQTRPAKPTWLIVYRDRRGEGSYLELNRRAAEIAALVRDNRAGRTGSELLAAAGARFPFAEPAAVLRDGLGILDVLRQRRIVFCARRPGRARA